MDAVGDLVLLTEVLAGGFFVAPLVIFAKRLLFGKREILLSDGLVVSERGHLERKEFAPFPSFFHVLDDPVFEGVIFFLGILFIEDTVFGSDRSDTSKAVFGVMTVHPVKDIRDLLIDVDPGDDVVGVNPDGEAFADFLDLHAVFIDVKAVRVWPIVNPVAVAHIARFLDIKGVADILTSKDLVAFTRFVLVSLKRSMRKRFYEV